MLPAESAPFDLHCWFEAWWGAFGEGELAVCAARRQGKLAAVFPAHRVEGRLRPLANEHTPQFRPLAADGEALEAVCAATIEAAGGELDLAYLPGGDPALDGLQGGARAARRPRAIETQHSSPYVATDGDFDAWRASSKKRWGAPLERFRRKMGRDHEAELAVVEPAADLEAELDRGFRVEASGWKGEQGTAILSRPETEAFYRVVGETFAARGELRLSSVTLDGETAAFDLCVLHGGRLYLLKTGYDERFRRLAPGLVMRLSIIERCFELGLRSHELLGTESEWKAKFQTGVRERLRMRVFPRGPLGVARGLYRGRVRPLLRRAYRGWG